MARTSALAAMALSALALTACGQLPDGAAAPPAPETLAVPEGTILTANSTAQLGTVVIDGLGRTLYRFEQDTTQPPTSTCVDRCATTWPPVLAEPGTPLVVEGVAQDAIGTVTRPDGGVQITIAGRPVYRYSADPAPGATDGHGVDDAWFAVTPEGARAEAP